METTTSRGLEDEGGSLLEKEIRRIETEYEDRVRKKIIQELDKQKEGQSVKADSG
jgi:hypothetical protein